VRRAWVLPVALAAAIALALVLALALARPTAPRSGPPPGPGPEDEAAIRATVARYYALLDRGRTGPARALLAADARAAAGRERDPYVAARVALGAVRRTGSTNLAEVEVRSLLTVQARGGCAQRRDGAIALAREGGGWRIASFDGLGRPGGCDCASVPWRVLPRPGRPDPPVLEGTLTRVVATAAYVSSPAVGLRRPQGIDPAGALRWTVPGSGVGFDVTLALERAAQVRCVSVNRASSGPRPTLLTVTSPGRAPTALPLAEVRGLQWLKRDYGRTDDVTVHIDAVRPAGLTTPPALQVQVWALPRA